MIPIEYLGIMIPILAIVLGISLGFFGVWTHHKQKLVKMQMEADAKATGGNSTLLAGQVEELQDRVRVLERIVTDRGFDVAHQIEALRDQRELDRLERPAAETARLD